MPLWLVLLGLYVREGVSVAEDAERGGSGHLPGFRDREYDRERVEQSEERDRKRDWPPEAIGLVVDLISSLL